MPGDSAHCKRFAERQHSHFGTKVQCNMTSDLMAVNYPWVALTACDLSFSSQFADLGFRWYKPHGVSLGKWTTVKWLIGSEESQPLDLKVRLIVDGHAKEFLTSRPTTLTEHLFVVRRAFCVNDRLPDDKVPTTPLPPRFT
jgi:hypothetical protein